MDIKLTWIAPNHLTVHKAFRITVNGSEVGGKAYNRLVSMGIYRLYLVFQNKDVKKHPKYKEIRAKTIQLLLKATQGTIFSQSVRE